MLLIKSSAGLICEIPDRAPVAWAPELLAATRAERAAQARTRALAFWTGRGLGVSQGPGGQAPRAAPKPETPPRLSLMKAAAVPVSPLAGPPTRPTRPGVEDGEAATKSAIEEAVKADKVGELVRLVPLLKDLAGDPRPAVRQTCSLCFSILAKAGRAPADREIWRLLLGLSKYDEDPSVRRAADLALADLERHGTVAS